MTVTSEQVPRRPQLAPLLPPRRRSRAHQLHLLRGALPVGFLRSSLPGLAPLAARGSTAVALLLLCAATSGAFCTYGPFFSWPAVWAGAGAEAACSVSIINSLGNVGGMVGPALVGLLSQVEGGAEASEHIHALIVLGSTALVAGLMCAVFQPVAIREQQQWCCLTVFSTPLLHLHSAERSDEVVEQREGA